MCKSIIMIQASKILVVCLCMAILFGCQSKQAEVAHEKVTFQVLHHEIMTRMPGSIAVAGDYLMWYDPFARDYFVNIHDIQTGELIGKMGKVGEGPSEFITGSISSCCIDGSFFASDANGNTCGFLSVDSLIAGKEPFTPLSAEEKEQRPLMNELQKGVFIGTTEDGEEHYFKTNIHGKEGAFGVYPIKEVKQHLGNTLAYDSISGMLACCSFSVPYLALYKKSGDSFKLCWEKEPEMGYEISRGNIVPDETIGGVFGLSLCKDYIVSLHRDWENERLDKSITGRDERMLPHLAYLYDYGGSLVKVADLGVRVVRIASDRRSNTLYALVLNPDYMLVKYEL